MPLLPTELLRTRLTPSKPALPEDVLSIVPPLRTLTFIGKLVAKEVVLDAPTKLVLDVPALAMVLERVPPPTLVLTLMPLEVSTESARPGSEERLTSEVDLAFLDPSDAEEPRSIWSEPSGFNCVVIRVTLPSSFVWGGETIFEVPSAPIAKLAPLEALTFTPLPSELTPMDISPVEETWEYSDVSPDNSISTLVEASRLRLKLTPGGRFI